MGKNRERSWEWYRGSVCFKNSACHMKTVPLGMRESYLFMHKGYWWFHWGPPGPSLWPSDSFSVHWHSSPAHLDSPETTNRNVLTNWIMHPNLKLYPLPEATHQNIISQSINITEASLENILLQILCKRMWDNNQFSYYSGWWKVIFNCSHFLFSHKCCDQYRCALRCSAQQTYSNHIKK